MVDVLLCVLFFFLVCVCVFVSLICFVGVLDSRRG